MPLLHRSITSLPEKELVARVLADPLERDTLMNIKGLEADGAFIDREVPWSRLSPGVDGEIDVLVIPSDAPEQSTAIQVKRFPIVVGVHDKRGGHWRRLGKLFAEGVLQAQRDMERGFSQVYLWVFVLVDTRDQNGGRLTYDGPDTLIQARIEQATSTCALDSQIGLIVFDWVQPMDRAPFELGAGGGHLRNLAQTRRQPDRLTQQLRKWRWRVGDVAAGRK